MAFNAYLDKMVCGLHFDGSNGSTTVTDIKGNTWTKGSQFALTTAEKKFGTASGNFSGGGGGPDAISTESASAASGFTIGSSDFTICGWIKFQSNSGEQTILDVTNIAQTIFYDFMANGDTLRFRNLYTGSYTINLSSGNLSLGTSNWHFVGVRRAGTALSIWCDGVSVAEATTSDPLMNGTFGSAIMGTHSGAGSTMAAYVDDFQVYNGVALDLSIVPTEEFGDLAYPVHTSHLFTQGINAANQAAFINVAGL
jgi:hypothetical protein